MKIAGVQKTSLQDFPGRVACIVFLAGCNFRCGFCHNPELINFTGKEESEDDFFDFLEKRKGKLDGVVITGGEPLLNSEVLEFCKKIRGMGFEIKIDTNGSSPEILKNLIENKLVDFIAMDIKNSKKKYKETVGVNVNLENIEKSIKLITNSGLDYEFRITVMPKYHDTGSMEEIRKWLEKLAGKKLKKFAVQNFVNSGKILNPQLKDEKGFKSAELKEFASLFEDIFESVEVRD